MSYADRGCLATLGLWALIGFVVTIAILIINQLFT